MDFITIKNKLLYFYLFTSEPCRVLSLGREKCTKMKQQQASGRNLHAKGRKLGNGKYTLKLQYTNQLVAVPCAV